MKPDKMLDDPAFLAGLRTAIVGRHRELELLVAALGANRHVLFEGPPGTGKSTILRTVAATAGSDLVFVEGNAELTPARLTGVRPIQGDGGGVRASCLCGRTVGGGSENRLIALRRGTEPGAGGDNQSPDHGDSSTHPG